MDLSRLDRTGQDEEQAQANSLRRPPSKCSPFALPTLDPSVSPFRCDNLSFFAVVLLPTLAAKSQSESYRMKVRSRPLLSSVVMLISNFHLRSRLVHGCSPAFRPSSLHNSPSVCTFATVCAFCLEDLDKLSCVSRAFLFSLRCTCSVAYVAGRFKHLRAQLLLPLLCLARFHFHPALSTRCLATPP